MLIKGNYGYDNEERGTARNKRLASCLAPKREVGEGAYYRRYYAKDKTE